MCELEGLVSGVAATLIFICIRCFIDRAYLM